MTRGVVPAAGRVGRDGALRLRFERRGERTVLGAWRSTLPLQVLAPVALPDTAAVVSVLNPTGGLVGGDRLHIDVTVEANAHALVTTPSATKVYRTAGPAAEQVVRLDVGADAILEWVPDHTIPFPGSALRQRVAVRLACGARLILVDAFAAGRAARGELWQFVLLESAVEISDPTGGFYVDRFMLDADRQPGARPGHLGGAEGHAYFATAVIVAPGDLGGCAHAVTGMSSGAMVGAAVVRERGLVVRILARSAPALGAAIGHVWAEARARFLDLPPVDLRK